MLIAFLLAAPAVPEATAIDPASWFSPNDYPIEAMKKGVEGSVTFDVEVDPEGRPTGCRVTVSSGSQALDQVTCDMVQSKGRFIPAKGPDGRAVAGHYSSRANWVLQPQRVSSTSNSDDTSTMGVHELEPGHFRCEAPAGNYINHEIPALPVRKPVVVRFKLIAEHPDPKWLEQTGFYFETPTGRKRVQVGKADNDQQHMYVAAWGENSDPEIVDQYPATNDWIALTLTLKDDGTVQVDSRGHKASLDLGTPWPVKTEIHCHSGAFEIQVLRPSQ